MNEVTLVSPLNFEAGISPFLNSNWERFSFSSTALDYFFLNISQDDSYGSSSLGSTKLGAPKQNWPPPLTAVCPSSLRADLDKHTNYKASEYAHYWSYPGI